MSVARLDLADRQAMAIHRENHWTPEEDQRLLDLIGSGKSWVLISALLKRSQLSINDRARHLKRKSAKTRPLD
jgi:Myb-like DNA-binding domain